MKRTRIAPRTYVDPAGRYWARFPVNRRYTWRLLSAVKTKREAIAAAQSIAGHVLVEGFTALARLYLAAGCPTRKQKFKRPSAGFIAAETRQAKPLMAYFRALPVDKVNDLLQCDPYAQWRLRQFKGDKGSRAVDKELQTLSNILNYAVHVTKQERVNYVQANRPRYHVVKSRARDRMPASATVIHQLADHFLSGPIRSEVMAWLTLFGMFTGCRTSELLRLRLDAIAGQAGHVGDGHLRLDRSKQGINPWAIVGPEFEQMLACFHVWHRKRFARSKVYFPGPFGDVVDATSHVHAMVRACKELGLPHLTPHGLRAYYVTKRRREGALDSHVAAEIGDQTVGLIASTYGQNTGGPALSWLPAEGLPAWLKWQPAAAKIARIA